jgi:hypothetical protein
MHHTKYFIGINANPHKNFTDEETETEQFQVIGSSTEPEFNPTTNDTVTLLTLVPRTPWNPTTLIWMMLLTSPSKGNVPRPLVKEPLPVPPKARYIPASR